MPNFKMFNGNVDDMELRNITESSNNLENEKTHQKGFLVSIPIAFIILLLAIILVVIVGFLSYFFANKEIICKCQYPTGAPPLINPTISPEAQWKNCIDLAKARKDCLPNPDVACTTLPPSTSVAPTTPPLIKDVRLPTDLRPQLYTLELFPNIYTTEESKMDFEGSVTINVRCYKKTNTFFLHSTGLTYENVKIRDASPKNAYNLLEVTRAKYDEDREWTQFTLKSEYFQADKQYKIEITNFKGQLKNDMRGLYLSTYKVANKTVYIATSQLQPTDARKVFPCFDEPKFKAKFDISIKKKKGYIALSNMKEISNKTDGGFEISKFNTTLLMSTYLLAFQVHQFDKQELFDQKNRSFRVWARPSVINTATYSNEAGVKITNFFESYFQTEYPLDKTDQVAVTDFNAGAMENWGLIIYRESAMLWSSTIGTALQRQRVAGVVSHELAHQWFGNLVTPEWWDDIWLNEGFASFVQILGVDSIHPEWKMDEQFLLTNMHNVMVMDSYGSSHPIYMTVFNPNQINSIFDTITYSKGASVLRMLHSFLGHNLFGEAIGIYLTKNQYNVTQYPQLWSTLTEEAKKSGNNIDISQIMNTWILQMGYPVVNVEKKEKKLYLKQKHFFTDENQIADPKYPNVFNYTWSIPITWTSSSTYETRNKNTTDVIWFDKKSDTKDVEIPNDDWFILNVQQKGFYRVNYEEDNWKSITQQLMTDHTKIDIRNRAQLIDDSFRLASANQLRFEVALELTKYLKKETEYVPWSATINNLAYITQMLSRDAYYGDLEKYMQRQLETIYKNINGWQQNATDDHLTKLLRNRVVTAACAFELKECMSEAKTMFQKWQNDSTHPIPPDLRQTAYCMGVALGGKEEFEVVMERFLIEDIIDIKSSLMYALSCSRSPWILKTLLDYSIDDTKIRRQDSVTVINNVANTVIGRDLAWNFIRAEWKTLSDRFQGAFTLKNLIERSLRYMNSQREVDEIEAFKNANRGTLGTGALALDEVIATVRTNVVWMGKFRLTIGEWLRTKSI